MYFQNPRTHAIPFFIFSKILPIHLLYFEAVLHSMYDVSNNSAPKDIWKICQDQLDSFI